LTKSIDYYKKNFKNTSLKIIPERNLGENLDVLTESQLFEVNHVLDFCHNPIEFEKFDVERLIVSIPDHDVMKFIIAKIKKRIPGFRLRMELLKLENQESQIEKRKKELKKNIVKAQESYKTRVIKTDKEKIEIKNKQINCTYPGCKKVCNSPAGLASHLRSAHKPKENEGPVPKSLKNGKGITIPGSKGTVKIG